MGFWVILVNLNGLNQKNTYIFASLYKLFN